MFCLLELSLVFLGAPTAMSRHDAQGRSPAPLQHPLRGCLDTTRDTKAPEHRQTAACSLLALHSQSPIRGSSTACLLLLSRAVALQHVAAFSAHTKLPSGNRERGHMDSIFCTHVYSFRNEYMILQFASLSPNSSTSSK